MTTGIIITILVVLSPVIYFAGGFILKLVWGIWPVIICTAVGGLILYKYGLEFMFALPVAIVLGLLGAWLWQRSQLFLAFDAKIGKYVFFD